MTITDAAPGTDTGLQLRIDGTEPLSYDLVTKVNAFTNRVQDAGEGAVALVHLTGAPTGPGRADGINVHLVNKWEGALRRLERLGAGTVAVAGGDCGGVASEILLCTDYRLATRDLRILLPDGLDVAWPGMGVYRLANQVGVARIRRSVLFGVPITATDALALDLVHELVDDVEAGIAAVTALVAACSGPELAVRRQLLLDATTTSFEEALGRHLAACDRELRRLQSDAGADQAIA